MTHERADGPAEDEQALSVLRGIWTARRQTGADLDPAGPVKVCKNMKDIGFGGMAGEPGAGDSTAGPVDEELRSAWRRRLEREGKLVPGARSVREIVLGADGSRP
jgi:hypothetical protein